MDNIKKNIASEKWNEAHAIPKYRQRFFNSVDWARKYSQELYLGDKFPFQILKENLAKSTKIKALELAGGRGDFSIALLKSGVADSVHMIDISDKAVDIARKKAIDNKVTRFTAEVQDVNEVKINGNYDLIVFSQSLHHISQLEYVLSHVKSALTPKGILYISDYIGPTRMQWTELQLKIMNTLLQTIPENLRVQLNRDGTISDLIKKEIKRIPVETFLKVDPSEAVRSEEIFGVVNKTFEKVDFFSLGGGLTYELFRNIAHNFGPENLIGTSIMKMIINLEYILTSQEVIETNFGIFVCRP